MADPKNHNKSADPDDIMSPAEMKPILALSRRERPVSCAIALTKDKVGIILFDRKIKPRKLGDDLKKQAVSTGLILDAPTLRFGHAMVDRSVDASLVTIVVNRGAPNSMHPPLLDRLRKAGFVKLDLITSAEIEDEPDVEEEEEDKPEEEKAPATAEDIMGLADMKQMLAIARRGRPVSCAVALSKDKEGILLLDRKARPKNVAAMMRKQAADLGLELDNTTVRFGHAAVDAEEDAGRAVITVNRNAPNALQISLLARLRKAGFGDVELIVESALEDEDEDEAPADGGSGEPAGETDADKKALHAAAAAVADLIKHIPAILAKAPSEKAALLGLAAKATDMIKAGDARGALLAAHSLKSAVSEATAHLNGAAGSGQTKPATAGEIAADQAKLDTLAKIWEASEAKLRQSVELLGKELAGLFDGDDASSKMASEFQSHFDDIFDTFDGTLARQLAASAKCKSTDELDKIKADIRKTIDSHRKFVASDKSVAFIKENPLVDIDIDGLCQRAFDRMEKLIS